MRQWILFVLLLCGTTAGAEPIQHEFIAIDEGLTNLFHIDQRDPGKYWLVHLGHPQARDLQLVGGNRILLGHDSGFSEFDIATGKVLTNVSLFSGVTSVRRQPGGNTLVAGVNLAGAKGIVVLEMDPANEIKRKTIYSGDYVRLVRKTVRGSLLMVCNTAIREADGDGKYLWEEPVEGFSHAWKAVSLPNGNTLASAGYGAFMVELDSARKIIRKFGGKGQVSAVVHPNFYATFQLLPNGNVVVANWQGHGPGHGKSGVQLLEFDPSGAVVWQWSNPEMISSLQGVLILDGLNPALLHDERNGVMEPLTAK